MAWGGPPIYLMTYVLRHLHPGVCRCVLPVTDTRPVSPQVSIVPDTGVPIIVTVFFLSAYWGNGEKKHHCFLLHEDTSGGGAILVLCHETLNQPSVFHGHVMLKTFLSCHHPQR